MHSANEALRMSDNGLSLLKQHEGLRLKAYQDSKGVWTIGYGLTSAAGIIRVYKGLVITREQAEDYYKQALVKYENCVKDVIKVPLKQHQFDALTSFCYNIGPGAFTRSTVAKLVNAERFEAVPASMKLWIRSGKTYPKGLPRRRKAEGDLFLGSKNFASKKDSATGA